MNLRRGSENRQGHSAGLGGFIASSVRAQNITALLIILFFTGINIFSVWRNYSLTTDEDKHYLYGERIVSGNSTRFDDSKMPVTGLNALPQKIASFLDDGRIKQVLSRLYVARAITIFFSCLLAWLVFHWSRSLYGFIPALFSLTLYVLDPNIIAHSQLVTTDLYVTGAIVFAFFALWRFANKRNLRNGLICLFALGISQVTKYTAIVLYPLFLISLLIYDTPKWADIAHGKEKIKTLLLKYAKFTIFAFIVSVIIINLGFLFNNTFTPFGNYKFVSNMFTSLQTDLPILHNLPVPVPYPYLQGLDLIQNNERTGSFYGNIYLLGRVSTLEGFPGYYIIASALKVPIATQIFLILAFVVYFTSKKRRLTLRINESFLLVPFLFFTIYFNFFFNTQIGIRYYLPIFPLLYVFTGNLFTGWQGFSPAQKTSVALLIAYLFVSVFSYYPYHLSYFNEIVWDRKQAYKYLADSNIDWGQGRNALDQYLLEHPDAVYKPGKARSGHLIIRVNDLVGVTTDPSQYAWLRENFEPMDMIAYYYLIYKISPEEILELCNTTTYCNK